MLRFTLEYVLFVTLLLGIVGVRALVKGRTWRNRRSWEDWTD